MQALIPHCIAEKYGAQEMQGKFPAITLFLDISGFTEMTESLLRRGNEGAEALSSIINQIFDPLLNLIYASEGFVSTFAGDAFTALFPEETHPDPGAILILAEKMMNYFIKNPFQKTPWGNFLLEAKIGLGTGTVEWGILGQAEALGYYFKGPGIDAAAEAEHQCKPGYIAFRADSGFPVQDSRFGTALPNGFLLFKPQSTEQDMQRVFPLPPPISRETLQKFVPLDQLPHEVAGEFRNLTSLFIAFDASARDLQELFALVVSTVRDNGGFLNLLDFGDKGGVFLILFGAPIALEKSRQRALACALSLIERAPDLKIGVAAGPCFAGFIGSPLRATYTALGRVVNLSARLAVDAKPGEILLPHEQFADVPEFMLQILEERSYKGIGKAVRIAQLIGKGQKGINAPSIGVGRIEEKKQIHRWIEGSFARNTVEIIGISGEPGIGKTQLMEDIARELQTRADIINLNSETLVPTSFLPFQRYFQDLFTSFSGAEKPIDQFFAYLTSLLGPQVPGYIRNEILRAGPPLLSLAGIKDPQEPFYALDDQARYDRTIEAVTAFFSLLALQKPQILVIEQAQSMDEGTKEVLQRLQVRGQGLSLVICILSRLPVSQLLPNMAIHTVELAPFSPQEMEEAVKLWLRATPDQDFLGFLDRRTDRIPLFVFELLRFVQEKHWLHKEKGRAFLGDFPKESLPQSLEELILSQLNDLPRDVRGNISILSVLGPSFPEAIVPLMFEEDAKPFLEDLISRQIIKRNNKGILSFQKAILRESVYAIQLKSRTMELHKKAAEAWCILYPEKEQFSAEKALHFDRAELSDQAAPYYKLAGEAASHQFLNTEALNYYERFLQLSKNDREKALVRYERAQIYELQGKWALAIQEIEQGLGLAVLDGAEELYHLFFILMGQIQLKQSNLTAAKIYFERAIKDPRNLSVSPELVQARIDLGRVHQLSEEYGEAMNRYYEARDLAKDHAYLKEEGLAQYYLGNLFLLKNRKKEAMELYIQALHIFRQLNIPRLIANPLYDMSRLNQSEGRLDLAKQQIKEALEIYTQIGYKSGLSAAMLNLGLIEDQRGEFKKAKETFTRSKNIAEEIGESLAVAYTLFCMGVSAYKEGELDQALELLLEAHQSIIALDVKSYLGYTLSYLVAVLVRMGRGDAAVERAVEAIEVIERTGVDVENGRLWLALAELKEKNLPLSQKAEAQLHAIADKGSLPEPSAYQFYRKALMSAKEARYMNTLIPTLYHFGDYLIKHGQARAGESYIQKCYDIARQIGFNHTVLMLEQKYPSFLKR